MPLDKRMYVHHITYHAVVWRVWRRPLCVGCVVCAQFRSDLTSTMGANLMQGNIAAISNRGNIHDHVAKAQAATQAKEAAMIQVCG